MIRFKVAFVLRLVDDFSGQCIQRKKFEFYINGKQYKPVEKEEGLYVFLEPMERQTKVEIISSDYFPCISTVEKDQLNQSEPVADIRMFGKPGKSFDYRYSLCCGKINNPKNKFPTQVFAKKAKETGLILKELKVIDQRMHIVFQGFTKEILSGKTFALNGGKEIEVFVILDKIGINEYQIDRTISKKHKEGASLIRVYRSVTDEQGVYSIPVDIGEESFITEVIALQNK